MEYIFYLVVIVWWFWKIFKASLGIYEKDFDRKNREGLI